MPSFRRDVVNAYPELRGTKCETAMWSRVKRTSIRFPNPLLDRTLTLFPLNSSLQGRTSIGGLRRRRLWWGTGALGIFLELESNFLLRVVLAVFLAIYPNRVFIFDPIPLAPSVFLVPNPLHLGPLAQLSTVPP